MPTPTFTTPPDAPSRASPSTFVARANAFLAWLVAWVAELVSAVTWFNDTSVATAASSLSAAASELAAAATEGDVEDLRDEAELARDLAAAYAASALNAPGTNATSTSSHSLTLGSKDFTLVQTGKLFSVGQSVVVTRTSDPTKRLVGPITAFAANVLTVDAQLLSSTGGPYTDWTIALSAPALTAIASQAQAEAGTDNATLMTPLRTAQQIAARSPAVGVIVQDQASSGTSGGTITQGSWQTCPFQTEVRDPDNLVAIASNQMTLEPGRWEIRARRTVSWLCAISNSNGPQIVGAVARLYNVTAAAVEQHSNSNATTVQVNGTDTQQFGACFELEIIEVVDCSVDTTFRVDVFCKTATGAVYRHGQAITTGAVEVYGTFEAKRTGDA